MSKQMRIQDVQYDLLMQMETILGINRAEIISNLLKLEKIILDNEVVSIKLINKSGEEKEMFWGMTSPKAK